MLIEFDRVGKLFRSNGREHRAVGNVGLSIAAGEFVSMVGPSGCGKSTLLNMLAGFTAPTEGRITIDGVAVGATVPAGLGYIFQRDTVLPWLTVRRNVALGLRYRGVSRRDAAAKVASLLRLGRLEGFADALPHQLSGGMRRRVALLMSLACDPSILLLDEPFGALDTHTRTLLHHELIRIWRALGQTILLVTHDLDEAISLSDRVIVLSGPPSRVLLDERVDIPHPRDVFTVRQCDAFTRHHHAVWRVLGQEFQTAGALADQALAS